MPEAFGNGLQAGSLGLTVKCIVGISAVDDASKQDQCGIIRKPVLLQNGFERAFLAVMPEFDVLDVIGDGVEPFGFGHYLVRWHENELGILVDEFADEPGTR